MRVERLLIIKPSSLGDVVHALPALTALRDLYPRAHIAWLVNREWAEILDGQPLLDDAILFERRRWGQLAHLHEFIAFLRHLRGQAYDLVVDLQGLFRSGAMTALTGAPVRVGFADGREGSPLFYTLRVSVPPGVVHAVEKNLLLPRALGWSGDARAITLRLSHADRAYAHAVVRGRLGLRIALHPVATRLIKQWPIAEWISLAALLKTRLQATVIVTGSPADRNVLARHDASPPVTVGQATPEQAGFDGAVVAAGETTLMQLAALFETMDCVVTNDSGPMHLAAAVGTPVVAVFGSTDPARTGPYGGGHRVVRRPLWCSPCSDFSHRCWNLWAPLACLRTVSAAEVFEAITAQLGHHAQVSHDLA